jgi:Asp-tRNA(Asn)/Glu-tRNA(Gln) amidotransferase A subunit family amidase
VPAAAGEREDLVEQLRWALTAELGCRPTTRSEHGAWEKAIAELADAGATVEQVRERCALYRRRWPSMALTPIALVRWWGWLGSAGAGFVDTKLESRERWIAESSWQIEAEDAHWIVDEWDSLVDDEQRARFHELVDAARQQRAEAVA